MLSWSDAQIKPHAHNFYRTFILLASLTGHRTCLASAYAPRNKGHELCDGQTRKQSRVNQGEARWGRCSIYAVAPFKGQCWWRQQTVAAQGEPRVNWNRWSKQEWCRERTMTKQLQKKNGPLHMTDRGTGHCGYHRGYYAPASATFCFLFFFLPWAMIKRVLPKSGGVKGGGGVWNLALAGWWACSHVTAFIIIKGMLSESYWNVFSC